MEFPLTMCLRNNFASEFGAMKGHHERKKYLSCASSDGDQ